MPLAARAAGGARASFARGRQPPTGGHYREQLRNMQFEAAERAAAAAVGAPAPVGELLDEKEQKAEDDKTARRGAGPRELMPAKFNNNISPLDKAKDKHPGRGPHAILLPSVQLNQNLTLAQVSGHRILDNAKT